MSTMPCTTYNTLNAPSLVNHCVILLWVTLPETREMSAILVEAEVGGGAEVDRCDEEGSIGGLVG